MSSQTQRSIPTKDGVSLPPSCHPSKPVAPPTTVDDGEDSNSDPDEAVDVALVSFIQFQAQLLLIAPKICKIL